MYSELLTRLRQTYRAAADPVAAEAMARYLRDQFRFLGISAPRRRALAREVLSAVPPPGPGQLGGLALACWELPEREYQYFAVDLLVRYATRLPAEVLPRVACLITSRSWWDTVDPLATRVVGTLVRRHPALVTELDSWSEAEDLWLVRTALLHQLHHRRATDADRLFGYAKTQAGHRDFFVRKAIGWALRQYARTDPDAVREFVAVHRHRLSPLSAREALRHLGDP